MPREPPVACLIVGILAGVGIVSEDFWVVTGARDAGGAPSTCGAGAPEHPHPAPSVWPLIMKRASIAGSAIGGIPETQQMLDFCAKNNIVSDIETIAIQQIDEAYERMLKSDVKYRFVIDMASLK